METLLQNLLKKNLLKIHSNINVLHFNHDRFSISEYNDLLSFFPEVIQLNSLKYKKDMDRINNIIGVLLTVLGYYIAEGKVLNFSNYKKDLNGKPFIDDSEYQFNVSHSDNTVVCVFGNFDCGIDIEKETNVDFDDFRDVFTENEMEIIKKGGDKTFFEFWTQKEAVAKAIGIGVGLGFKQISLMKTPIVYNGKIYYLETFKLGNMPCAISYSSHESDIEFTFKSVNL